MGYQSKTYSLSDEVVRRIEMFATHFGSPNKAFLEILPESLDDIEPQADSQAQIRAEKIVQAIRPVDPRSIPGVSVGLPVPAPSNAGFPCVCKHTGCTGGDGKFLSARRGSDLCSGCVELGHSGSPAKCERCFEDAGPA